MMYTFMVVAMLNGSVMPPQEVKDELMCARIAHRLEQIYTQRGNEAVTGCLRFSEMNGTKQAWYLSDTGEWIELIPEGIEQ